MENEYQSSNNKNHQYKILAFVFLILFIISAVLAGYFGYRLYKREKGVEIPAYDSKADEEAWNKYVKDIANISVYGTIKEVNDEKIVMTTNDGEEKEFGYDEHFVVEKLEQDAEDETLSHFIETDKSELKTGLKIWLLFNNESPDKSIVVKIMEE